ncbi:MAG: glutamate synthase subunit alpha, partial [Chloroflexi bacterium]|nr:glutamate synthase subunit alpha [Chloroflexota bacterium]
MLEKQGLYDPGNERAACGVGVVANIRGERSHEIIRRGLQVLINLAHRGACGCDPDTGDGAGLLLQLPHDFLRRECAGLGLALPPPGEYGVGMVFLPRDPVQRRRCEELFGEAIVAEGQRLLGWRDVPVNASAIGLGARDVQPHIRQVFIGRGPGVTSEAELERKLYVIRRVVEKAVKQAWLSQRDYFYIPSLSANRIVYKGLLMAVQLEPFYRDLADPSMASAFALVHARFSTNTLGSWRLAHPYRFLLHNGEINTLRGNVNWMAARQGMFASDLFGSDLRKLFPIIESGQSDTACLDNALELLLATGRSLPHAVAMMIPEAWGDQVEMPPEKRAFYEYHAGLMEPWDGPALVAFTDGRRVGAVLDRNGLRPFRYLVTRDGLLVMASEVGVLDVPPEEVLYKARLQPGRMFLLDTAQGRIIQDEEIKAELARRRPYGQWLKEQVVQLAELPEPPPSQGHDPSTLVTRQQAFGYTLEDLRIVMEPMAASGQEPVGSMGNDTPLAVLSDRPQSLFNYFRQLFAQVTNPPLDAIREELVTSLETFVGSEQNLFDETPQHCRQLKLKSPVLTNRELEQIRGLALEGVRATTIPILFDPHGGAGGGPGQALAAALDQLCQSASAAVAAGHSIIILSDRGLDKDRAPIPSLLATSAVHHHLIREGTRTKVGLVVESGEPREVMHFCLLLGYGAAAVNPYLAFEAVADLARHGSLDSGKIDPKTAEKNFIKAISKGILKVMSKMG